MNAGEVQPGTLLYQLFDSYALEFERLYYGAALAASATFLQGAYGDLLDAKAAELGIVRQGAVPARALLRVEGTAGSILPAGSLVSTNATVETPVTFSTTYDFIVPSNGYGAVWATADEEGTDGNVPVDSLTVLEDPVPGIILVTNEEVAAGGLNDESDDEFRQRLREAWVSAPIGAGSEHDYERWAIEGAHGIVGARVFPRLGRPMSEQAESEIFLTRLSELPLTGADGPRQPFVFVYPYGEGYTRPTAEQIFRVQEYLDPSVLVIHSEMDGWADNQGFRSLAVPTVAATDRNRYVQPLAVPASYVNVPLRFHFPYPLDFTRRGWTGQFLTGIRCMAQYRRTGAPNFSTRFRFYDIDGNYVDSGADSFANAVDPTVISPSSTWVITGPFNFSAVVAFEVIAKSQTAETFEFISATFRFSNMGPLGVAPVNVVPVVMPPKTFPVTITLKGVQYEDDSIKASTQQVLVDVVRDGFCRLPNLNSTEDLMRLVLSVGNVTSVDSIVVASSSPFVIANAANSYASSQVTVRF